MMPQINPEQMKQVQAVSSGIHAKMVRDYKDNSVTLQLSVPSGNKQAITLSNKILNQFTDMLATQLSSFFAIKGEIIDRNKPAQ